MFPEFPVCVFMTWDTSLNLIGWLQIWVDYGPVGGLGRVPRPPSGPGSHPLALGHQLGMAFTKARPKFSTCVIIVDLVIHILKVFHLRPLFG